MSVVADPIVRDVTIGNCRLIEGDCLQIMQLLGAVDHVVCDPPYEAYMHAAKTQHCREIRTDGANETKPLDFASIDGIREPFVAAAQEMCGGWFIAFCTPEGVGRWADVINASSMKYKRANFWHKPDGSPQFNGQGPAAAGEMFVSAWAGRDHAKWNAGGKRGYYCHNTNSKNRDGRHPTEKSVPLMCEILEDFTAEGDLVIDPFMGSGTTGVACAKLGRRFIGIEQMPKYFSIAIERISKVTEGDLLVRNTQIGFDLGEVAR